jgi:aminoglycoside phosphotransferase (APT) family kinase protein
MRRGLLTAESIIVDEVSVRGASRRNHNFQLVRKRGAAYFLKQGIDPETRSTIEREAAMYRLLAAPEACPAFLPYLPKLIDFDAEHCLLIIELLPGASNLADYYGRKLRFPRRIGDQLGRALAALHAWPPPAELGGEESGGPSIFSLADVRLDSLRDLSAASIDLIKTLQRYHDLTELLAIAADEWVNTAIIHADLKGGNCVLCADEEGRAARRLKIVDWELARVGDPAWDIGSVFADYLAIWISSIPVPAEPVVERLPLLARCPLASLQPSMRAFWDAYVSARTSSFDSDLSLLLRAVRCTAVRLTQTAFEQSQGTNMLSPTAVCLLQVAWNLARRPAVGAVSLLGLRPPATWAA